MAFFHVFARFRLCLENFVPEGDKSRGVGHFTTNDVLLSENIHKKGQKGPKKVKIRFRLCLESIGAERDEITGRRPV